MTKWRAEILRGCVLALAYYATARLGLLLQLPGTNASPVWPPSGVGLAALLLFGLRLWPGIAAGAFLANLLTLPHTTAGVLAAATIGVGNTLEQVAALLLIRWLAPSPALFERSREVFSFLGATALAGTVASTVGATGLWLAGIVPAQAYSAVWFTWWLGDTAGILVLTPAIYCWWRAPHLGLSTARVLELAALLAFVALTAEAIFGGWVYSEVITSLPYLVVPGLLWAAFRFGPRETASVAVLLSVIAIGHTWKLMHHHAIGLPEQRGFAPFVSASLPPNDSLLLLQIFVCVVAVTAIVLAATMAGQIAAQRALAESERLVAQGEEQRRALMLERVHRAVLEMEQVEDFRRVVAVIAEQLAESGVKLEGVGVNIIDEEIGVLRYYNLQGDQLVTGTNTLEFPVNQQLLEHWRRGETWVRVSNDELKKVQLASYQPGIVIDVPFVQGTVVAGLRSTLEKSGPAVQILEMVAPLVSLGYTRTLDLALRQQAAETRAWLSMFVETTPDAIIGNDLKGFIIAWNPSAEELFGYSNEEVIGQHISILYPPGLEDEEAWVSDRIQRGESIEQFESLRRCRDGSLRGVSLTVSPITNSQGKVLSAANLVRDITARQEAEAATRLNHSLQRVRNEVLQVKDADGWLEVVVALHRELEELVHFTWCSVQVIDLPAGRFTSYQYQQEKGVVPLSYDLTPSLRKVVAENRTLYRRNRREIEELGDLVPEQAQINSIVDVPFLGGTIAMNSVAENAFSGQDLRTLEAFSQVASEAYRRLEDLRNLAEYQQRLVSAKEEAERVGRTHEAVINNVLDGIITTEPTRR